MSRHRTFLDKQHYTFYYSNHRNEKLYELSFLSVYSQILGHIFMTSKPRQNRYGLEDFTRYCFRQKIKGAMA